MTVEGHTLNFLYHSIFFIALTFGGTISEIVDLKTVISWIFFFFFFSLLNWLVEILSDLLICVAQKFMENEYENTRYWAAYTMVYGLLLEMGLGACRGQSPAMG